MGKMETKLKLPYEITTICKVREKELEAFLKKATIKIFIKVKETVNNPVFGLIIYDESSLYCYGTNTELKGYNIESIRGSGMMDFIIDAIPMLAGNYYLTIAVHSKDNIPFDWHERAYSFTVHNLTKDMGLFQVPCHWELIFEEVRDGGYFSG